MANTLFNDAALNVKVNLSSGGLQENELAAQNTITITTSGGAGTTSNLAELLDVDDDPTVNNGILIYNTANSTYTLTSIPQGAFVEYEYTAANGQTNFAGNDNNSASLNYRSADSLKVYLNGIPKKIDYDAYMVIRNQEEQLKNHETALLKYVLIYETKKKHNDDEKVLYKYCMQFPTITETLKQIKEEKEKEKKSEKVKV